MDYLRTIICWTMISVLLGCSPPQKNGSLAFVRNAVLIPGRGVDHACELGMSISEVSRQLHRQPRCVAVDASTGIRAYVVDDAPLKISTDAQKTVTKVTVLTQKDTTTGAPVFRGSVRGGLSFSNEVVQLDDVLRVFPKPDNTFETRDLGSRAYLHSFTSGIPHQVVGADRQITHLVYPSQGIGFRFVEEKVSEVFVEAPRKGPAE